MRLEVNDLYKSFGEVEVLHGISFEVVSGEAIGLLGRNGAGKTTTIRIIMDVFKANRGEILLDGQKFLPKKNHIGYLPEERGMYPRKKVLEQLIYFGALRGLSIKKAKTQASRLLSQLEIEEYKDRKMETLSKGNQQKVQLAQALLCDPDIVILDEPFSGLDPVNSQILKNIVLELIEKNKLVIFSSHQMNYVEEFCKHVAIINHGNIVLSGSINQIKKEYGKGRLVLSAENLSHTELEEFLSSHFKEFVTVEEKKKEFLVLALKQGVEKKKFVKALSEMEGMHSFSIEEFGNYRPTLNDIFIKVAKDEEDNIAAPE